MTPHDGRSNIGGKCTAPECDRILFLDPCFCPKHQSNHVISSAPDPVVKPSADINTKKRLHGPETRFVAKKSENVLRRGLSKRSSTSDHSRKSSEAITGDTPDSYARATTRQPAAICRSDRASEVSGPRREISETFPKSPAGIPPQKRPETVSSHDDDLLQAETSLSMHRAVAGYRQSSKDIVAENPARFSMIETEVLEVRHDFEIHKRTPIDDARKSTASPPLQQNCFARSDSAMTDKFNEQRQTDESYSSKQNRGLSEDKPSKQHTSSQISEELIRKHVMTQPSLGNAAFVRTASKAKSISALSLPQSPVIHKSLNHTRPSSEPQTIDNSWALNKRDFHAMSQDGCDSTRHSSVQAQLPRKTRIELVLEQTAMNRLGFTALSEQSKGNASSGNSQKRDMSYAGTMPSTDDVGPKVQTDIEKRHKSRLARFDSDAFDTMIYRQSSMRPPEGVLVSRRLPSRLAPSSEERRLALPVNPAIHSMHKRSEEWIRNKSKEIKERGGRKAWFGKPVQRQRWLRTQEAAKEKEREKARKAGKPPLRKDPEPWRFQRILDFGDVAEEDLPDDIRENLAWAKGRAWMRRSMQKAAQRQRTLDKTAEETRAFYRDVLNAMQ